MSDVILSNEVIIYLLSEMIIYTLMVIAFILTPNIIRNWDFSHFSSEQFKLENSSYLIITIISFTIMLKIILLPYFVYTIDELSNIVTGAMCGAGVVNSVSFGSTMFFYKILNLYIFGFWLVLHSFDLKNENQPYTKYKFLLYISDFSFWQQRFI